MPPSGLDAPVSAIRHAVLQLQHVQLLARIDISAPLFAARGDWNSEHRRLRSVHGSFASIHG